MFGNLFGGKKPASSGAGAGARPKAPSQAAGSKPEANPNPKARAAATAKLRRENLKKRFAILGETSQGSMSKVYRALDNKAGRTVCLKVQDKAKTAAAIERAVKIGRPTEGEIGMRMSHPRVVRTYEFGLTTEGEYYLVMDFIEGISLTEVRKNRVLALPDRLELLAQAAEALAEVHAKGFIHHDFGPKNLLVDRDDRVKLIDFGLAVPNTPTFRRPGNRTGTLNYMAPELLRRESTDERIDIFSFGVTTFEFLTRRLPYDDANISMATMTQRISQEPQDPAVVNPSLPEPVCALIRKTLARRPDDRWPRMDTLPEALRELASEYS